MEVKTQRALLIEGQDRAADFRDALTAGGYELVAIQPATRKICLPLGALADVIVLYAVRPDAAQDLLDRLRAVGFEMPAVMVTRRDAGTCGPSYSYTIDGGALEAAGVADFLTRLAALPRRAIPAGKGQARAVARDAEAPVSLDAEREVPTSRMAGRRRAGARPLGRRFQSSDILATTTRSGAPAS